MIDGEKYISAVAEQTDDGSMTLYRADIDEHYGSTRGARAESAHVYVDSCLRYAASRPDGARTLRVLEIGFGTGLNVAMSVGSVNRPVRYISLELHPLPELTAMQMDYERFVPVWVDIIKAPWNEPVEIAPGFVLEKRIADFLTAELPGEIDAVYYDAFAPEKQPELWSVECYGRVFEAMRCGGVLTTYCAKGAVRRGLEAAGFRVERLAGPVGGKREILRAIKPVDYGY